MMIFVSQPNIGGLVLKELRDAVEVRLAVAFFNPDEKVLSALCGVQQLSLIISIRLRLGFCTTTFFA
jgi:hypothetical protein